MRLRMFVSGRGLGQLAGFEVDIEVALRGAVDAIGPVQAGVEPLRRVRRAHLQRQHGADFVEENLRVVFGIEIAALPAPIGPGAGEAIEDLLGGGFADHAFGFGQQHHRFVVGDRAPQERGNGILFHLLQARGHAGLAEILLRQNVGGHLRPEFRNLDIVEPEHHRAVRILDLARGQTKFDPRVRRLAVFGVATFDPHCSFAPFSMIARSWERRHFFLRRGDWPPPTTLRLVFSSDAFVSMWGRNRVPGTIPLFPVPTAGPSSLTPATQIPPPPRANPGGSLVSQSWLKPSAGD